MKAEGIDGVYSAGAAKSFTRHLRNSTRSQTRFQSSFVLCVRDLELGVCEVFVVHNIFPVSASKTRKTTNVFIRHCHLYRFEASLLYVLLSPTVL
jgi:hypothetical protein